jgi:exodeoxyribonuclease V alpha subunit
MQVENDYDIGFVEEVDSEAGDLTAGFDGVDSADSTIHKSQGSKYPAVIIPVMTQHYAMPQRNLLYTGITRGKKLVVLVGRKRP